MLMMVGYQVYALLYELDLSYVGVVGLKSGRVSVHYHSTFFSWDNPDTYIIIHTHVHTLMSSL